MRVLKYRHGCATELLCRCKYFQVERWLINTERCRDMADFFTGANSFEVLLCISGCGDLFEKNTGETLRFIKGDCIFVPANSVELKIHGRAKLLRISC
jgi:mannose-6-phosphate isomerase